MTKNDIYIIKMGGTIEFIDPSYDSINNNLMKLDSSVDSYLKNLISPHFNYDIKIICEKDSREINEEDLENLKKEILSTDKENILITHGTFTMTKTGKFLEQLNLNKKIILTGAMIPIAGFSISDAAFNLGFSIASFNNIKSGVYLCMNGGVFKPEEVEKNIELLRFE